MPVFAKESKSGQYIEPAPQGLHSAVCVDVEELGIVNVTFKGVTKPQQMINIWWAVDEINPTTKRPYLARRRYNLSADETSNLRKDLQSWRGKAFNPGEMESFDIEKLIGVNCQIQIQHNIKTQGKVYANVITVVPAARNAPKLPIPSGYVRAGERKRRDELEASPDGQADPFYNEDAFEGPQVGDEDIPF